MDIFVLLDLKIVTLLCIYIATFCGVNSYLYQLVRKWSSNFFFITIGLLLSLTLIDILTENILKVKLSVVYFDNSLILKRKRLYYLFLNHIYLIKKKS